MIFELKKGNIIRIIKGRNLNARHQVSINGNKFDLTDNIELTHGKPILQFSKNGNNYYIREKFNKTESVTICAQTPNPRNSSQVYRVDNYIIPARAVNLSKLKIDVKITTKGSHNNDGVKIANGYVVLEALKNNSVVFSQKIFSDQTNGGDGASGFEGGTRIDSPISALMNDYSTEIYDLRISIYLLTGDYQAHVDSGQHRYQRVHGICVTVYD